MEISRRNFCRCLVEGGMTWASLPLAVQFLFSGRDAEGAPVEKLRKEVLFYSKIDKGRIRCEICPNHCALADGEWGICRARANHGGVHYVHAYGNPCILRPDPVEKVPLNQFIYKGLVLLCKIFHEPDGHLEIESETGHAFHRQIHLFYKFLFGLLRIPRQGMQIGHGKGSKPFQARKFAGLLPAKGIMGQFVEFAGQMVVGNLHVVLYQILPETGCKP